jgi:hypothetical protein
MQTLHSYLINMYHILKIGLNYVGRPTVGQSNSSGRVFSLTGIGMCDDDITFLFLRSGTPKIVAEDTPKKWRR